MGNNFDVQLIKEQLYEIQEGEIITFSALSALVGKDLQGEAYHLLHRAMLEMESDGYVFQNIRNVGYQRLTDEGRAMCDRTIRSIRNKSIRGIRQKTANINFAALGRAAQVTHNVHVTMLSMTKNLTTRKAMKRIERRLSNLTDKVDNIQSILDLCRSDKDK